MHSVPVAVLTAAEWRRDCRPKGTAAAPFPAIDIHYSGSPPPHPGDTNTLCPYQCWEQGFSPQLTTTAAAATLVSPFACVSLAPPLASLSKMPLIWRSAANLATDKASEESAGDPTTAKRTPPQSNAAADLSPTSAFKQTENLGAELIVE